MNSDMKNRETGDLNGIGSHRTAAEALPEKMENIPEFAQVCRNLKQGRRLHFVSGIDTNIGKTYATAFLLKKFKEAGLYPISQKMVQTGCRGISEDILKHRELCGVAPGEDDLNMLTSPVVFSYPASPHLAAEMDRGEIDFSKIDRAAQRLSEKYEIVLQEGAGGLMVPITRGGVLTIDYIRERNYPVILVTSSRLGSINHTLLSLDACRTRGIEVELIVYNRYPEEDRFIDEDTLRYLKESLDIPVLVMEAFGNR